MRAAGLVLSPGRDRGGNGVSLLEYSWSVPSRGAGSCGELGANLKTLGKKQHVLCEGTLFLVAIPALAGCPALG